MNYTVNENFNIKRFLNEIYIKHNDYIIENFQRQVACCNERWITIIYVQNIIRNQEFQSIPISANYLSKTDFNSKLVNTQIKKSILVFDIFIF